MLTLVLLALSIAALVATVAASVTRPAEPAPVEAAIPVAALGLRWRRLRDVQTRHGPRTLWAGDGETTAYTRAYGVARDALRGVGFSWGTTSPDRTGYVQPVCWEDPEIAESTVEAAIAQAEAALAVDDERLREVEARRYRDAELEAVVSGKTRRADLAALRESLDRLGWAWGTRKRAVAEALFAVPLDPAGVPTAAVARLARDLVDEVDAAIDLLRERIASDPAKDWLALAQDADVRGRVHAAVRYLTDMDEDQASVRNARGWGQSHSRVGHVLAGLETLTVIEATHALAAVHRHRRQLPADMRIALFGT